MVCLLRETQKWAAWFCPSFAEYGAPRPENFPPAVFATPSGMLFEKRKDLVSSEALLRGGGKLSQPFFRGLQLRAKSFAQRKGHTVGCCCGNW